MAKTKQPSDFNLPPPNDREGFEDNEWDNDAGEQGQDLPLRDEDDDWGRLSSLDENGGIEGEAKHGKAEPKADPFDRPPPIFSNEKQIPLSSKKPPPKDNPKPKPDFTTFKNSKLPPPKDTDPINHINLNGNSKPHLGIGSKKPLSNLISSHKEEDLEASHMWLSSHSTKPQQINPFSSMPQMLDTRPKYEKLLEKAEDFIRDKSLRSLEALFDFNTEGKTLLREINELVTRAFEKHKAKIIAEPPALKPTSAKLSKTREALSTDRYKSQFQKELEAGEKLMNNLAHEFRELTLQEQKISNPT